MLRRNLEISEQRAGRTLCACVCESGLIFVEPPSGDGIGEVFRVFVLRKDDLGLDAKDTAIRSHQKRLHVAAVFGIVNFSELLPDRAIRDFLRGAFQNDSFVGFFGSNEIGRASCRERV